MIEVRELTKRYRDLVAVDRVSFNVTKGEIVGFLGLNGAGKSTTMKVVTGYIPATTGTAKVAGFDVFEEPMEVKRRIGYLPEIVPIYPDLTVTEYLDFVASIKGVAKKAKKGEIERVLEKAQLKDVRERLTGNLSKGFQQRCGIAQALLGNPPVLILDEPTSGLDPQQQRNVRELIQALAAEHTIMLSTHNLAEVEQICKRAIIIHRGKLAADDLVQNLISRYKTPERTPNFYEVFDTMLNDLDRQATPAANTAVRAA
ncbi:MAG: ABC transporter ATP-binding protein [Deltaproteobacteria bacterium]|nr:ABC transporter ATP-binding protein [Deltaproteobacteria bacterium]